MACALLAHFLHLCMLFPVSSAQECIHSLTPMTPTDQSTSVDFLVLTGCQPSLQTIHFRGPDTIGKFWLLAHDLEVPEILTEKLQCSGSWPDCCGGTSSQNPPLRVQELGCIFEASETGSHNTAAPALGVDEPRPESLPELTGCPHVPLPTRSLGRSSVCISRMCAH